MYGVRGTIKNLVFRALKSGKVSVRDPEEFAKVANDVIPSIKTLYMPIEDMLEESAEVVNAPSPPSFPSLSIPETLLVHKLVREITKDNVPYIKFSKLSRDD